MRDKIQLSSFNKALCRAIASGLVVTRTCFEWLVTDNLQEIDIEIRCDDQSSARKGGSVADYDGRMLVHELGSPCGNSQNDELLKADRSPRPSRRCQGYLDLAPIAGTS